MRYLLIIFLLYIPSSGVAQPSDFIILKKKDKTVRSYYAGTNIEFVTVTGAYRDALINKIQNDTLYIQEFLVRQVQTQMGFYIIDTAGSFRYAYHYKDIRSIGKPQKGFNLRGSGSALLGGGILLTLASAVVFVADRDKFSPELMGTAAGLGIIGYFLSKAGSKGIVIGKKNYRLEYMNMTSK